MSRYIDADALKEYVNGCEFCNNCQHKKNRCAFDCDLPDYLTSEWERVIDEQPTVDAVPVVRCRECKHRIMNDHYGEKGYFDLKAMCDLDTGDIFELGRYAEIDDWFCADGERRTDEQ